MSDIYCVQSGLGKTYFCQHNIGYVDLDAGCFQENRECYFRFLDYCRVSGYKILASAEPWIIQHLLDNGYNFILVYIEEGCKTEVVKRVEDRNTEGIWPFLYNKIYNTLYNFYKTVNCEKVILKSGQYLSDVLEKEPE